MARASRSVLCLTLGLTAFGKGLGDLPDGPPFLRPLSVTGTGGGDVPLNKEAPNVLTYGVAIEYSLAYLPQNPRLLETGRAAE